MSSPDGSRLRFNPLWQLTLSRLREFWREPESIFWGYGFPLIMVVALGIAFRNKPVETVAVCVVNSPQSAAIAPALEGNRRFTVTNGSHEVCRTQLRTGRSDIMVSRDAAGLVYRFDTTRPESALARSYVDDTLQRAAGRDDHVAVLEENETETGARYIDFLVPGLIGSALMGGGLWGVGFAVVDMRLRRLLKKFYATPMRKRDFLLGIVFSRLIFLIPETIVIVAFSWAAFGVHLSGTIGALSVVCMVGALAFSGIGLLVGSRAQTLETCMGLINLVSMPMWVLSGIFFSKERFPAIMQPLINALPLTPLNDALRLVMQEGASLTMVAPQLAATAAWGIVTFALALKWFRWA